MSRPAGFKHKDESKAKIKASLTGKPKSSDHKQMISAARKKQEAERALADQAAR